MPCFFQIRHIIYVKAILKITQFFISCLPFRSLVSGNAVYVDKLVNYPGLLYRMLKCFHVSKITKVVSKSGRIRITDTDMTLYNTWRNTHLADTNIFLYYHGIYSLNTVTSAFSCAYTYLTSVHFTLSDVAIVYPNKAHEYITSRYKTYELISFSIFVILF